MRCPSQCQPAWLVTEARAEAAVSSGGRAFLALLRGVKSQPMYVSDTKSHTTPPIPYGSFKPSFFTNTHAIETSIFARQQSRKVAFSHCFHSGPVLSFCSCQPKS